MLKMHSSIASSRYHRKTLGPGVDELTGKERDGNEKATQQGGCILERYAFYCLGNWLIESSRSHSN